MWWIGLIVGIIAALILAGGIWYAVRAHRKGNCGGCPGCSGTKGCSGCPSGKTPDKPGIHK